MHVARIADPIWLGAEHKRMSRDLIEHEFRGPGDTIEAAAYRLQTTWGVPASNFLQGWSRSPREMLVSRWMAVFAVHASVFPDRVRRAARRHYEDMRIEADEECHPALVRLADLVAGHDPGPARTAAHTTQQRPATPDG